MYPDMLELKDITDTEVHNTVPSLSGGDTLDDKVKYSVTLAVTAERYPWETWIYVFTDGSATSTAATGGAGMCPLPRRRDSDNKYVLLKTLLQRPSGNRKPHASRLLCSHCNDHKQVVLLPDTLSVLQKCQMHKPPNLAKAQQHVAATKKTVL